MEWKDWTLVIRHSRFFSVILIFTLVSGIIQFNSFLPKANAADAVRKSLDVNKTLVAPVIDGSLDESIWNLDQQLDTRQGEGNFKDSSFGLLWDNRYLYIGVKLEDDNLIANGSGYWFEQDNINVFFDPTMHRSTPFAKDDMQLGFVYQPGTTTPEFHFGAALNNHSGKDEKKLLRAIQTTNNGWSLELAVPWDMLNIDPLVTRQLGIEIGASDRYDTDPSKIRNSYWSAYNTLSFWNNTSGFGQINLVDSNPVTGAVNPVLLEENFDGYADGELPFGWISDVNAGSTPISVVRDTYGNGALKFDGNASGKQARITAPVQWDNYVIEADVKFEEVLNGGRWAAIMFRGASNGKNPYNQMAVRQDGRYEVALRKQDNQWATPTPVTGTWNPLMLNEDYSWKIRVSGSNVKEYIKAKGDPDYTLVVDQNLGPDVLLEKGKVGFQADQSKVSFDNLKVTRITAERLDVTLPSTLEALTTPVSVTGSVYQSDGIADLVTDKQIKLYSSDESVIKIINNKIVPIKEGSATVKAVYINAEATQHIVVTPSTTGVQTISLVPDEGYKLAITGTEIPLDTLTFKADFSDYTSGTLKGDELSWSSRNPAVVIEDGVIKVQQKGAHLLTVQMDSATATMLIAAKDAADPEYVLYEENFDAVADGSLPEGWIRKEGAAVGKAGVKDGALEIDASSSPNNPSRVLLPEYLAMFGDYKIEADVTHLAANDAARWNSIMYRIQNNNYPYYQMAVRKDATASNGVEFSERTPANAWNVMDRGTYTEALDPAKMYHYVVKTFGNRVEQQIDDKLINNNDMATAYAKGGIGFQANGSKMKVDNVRVSLQQNALSPLPSDLFVNVTEPETKISIAPSVVTEIKSMNDLSALTGTTLPATVIVHVNGSLKVTDPSGQTLIGDLDSMIDAIGARMIPAFYVKDEQTVNGLVDALKSKGIEDAFVISVNGDLVKRARTLYPMIRGIVDFSSMNIVSKEDLMDIRRKTTVSLSKIAILPQKASSMENVAYLQQRAIIVWTQEAASQADKSLSLHQLITAGLNGIVTDSPTKAFEAYKVYDHETTLIRKPYIIAHRGMPSVSPENTLISNKLGLEAGADFIENDMFLTLDGHLIITHSQELSTTTNGSGNVESYNLAYLKTLNANKPYPNGFPFEPMVTLDEQIDLARQSGKMVMAEIKTSTPAAVDAFVRIIKEKNAEDVINAMSFDANQLKRLALLMPEMPSGLLTGYIANESNVSRSLRETLKVLQPLNATFNTDYSGLGKNFMEAAKHRGILVSPWTFNNKADFIRLFKLGAFGITTDYSFWASDWAAAIKPEKDHYVLEKNETIPILAEVESFKGDKTNVTPDLVWLDGQDLVEVNGSKMTAKKSGTAHALYRYTASMDESNTNRYDIYTQPVAFEIKGQEPEEPNGGSPGWNDGKLEATKITQSGLTLTWSAASDEDSVTEYIVYLGDKVFRTVDGTVRSIDVSGLNAGTEYIFTVQAGNKAGKWSTNGPSIKVMTRVESGTGGGGNGTGTGGTGGTEIPVIPANPTDVIVAVDGIVDAATLKKTFDAFSQVKVKFSGEKLELAAAGLLDASRKKDQVLVIMGEHATYSLPLSTLNLEALAKQLNISVDAMSIRVTLQKLSGRDAEAVENSVIAAGGTSVADAVNFEVEAVNQEGKSITVSFGSTYVSRDIVLNKVVDPSKATGVQMIPGTNRMKFVPTLFFTKDGKTTATLKRNGNSLYTVIENNISFTDMANHWARAEVELLANKLVVNGVSDHRFDGDRNISRAEFAALLVRALSLDPVKAAPSFHDVNSTAWYAEDVVTAVSAGLISGYQDGTFRPDQEITRKELATMAIRALTYAGIATEISAEKQAEMLSKFKDVQAVGWGNSEMAAAINVGLLQGTTANTLGSESYATRAQSAVVLKRLLSKANFIN
ncbi:glycerophosphodiester phosphodiesterase family protein [Cohnella sp. WQ 127256]|uniref:glycerophosphodiester phosphodiesterase family protein n=1 Tax=Cohnella sp. WQ 127256 TaxID=2938790 RepID=UPI0021179E74